VTTTQKPTYEHWLALLLFLGVGVFGYLLKAIDGFHATPGDLIDARFNSVILEHLYNWLRHGLNGNWTDIWSPAFFYPYQNVLAFSDNHFGTAFSYIFLRSIGLSREISFSGWYVIGFCLNFACSYLVFRRLQFSAFASSAAAFVFTFALPVIAQDGHSQFSYRFAIPLAFLALWNFGINRNLPSLAWLAFWTSLQFLCSIYMGVFLSIFLATCLLPIYLLTRNSGAISNAGAWVTCNSKSNWVYLALLIVSVLVSLSLAIKYQAVSKLYGFSPDALEISQMIPRLESYLIADRSELSGFIGKAFAENLAKSPYRNEHQLFLGVGVIIFLALGTIFCWIGKVTQNSHPNQMQIQVGKIACIALITLFLGTLMYGVGSAWMQLAIIPGINAIRAVTRIILIMIFPVSIMVAIACEKLYYGATFNSSTKRFSLIIGAAILLCSETLFFHNSKTPIRAWSERIQNLEDDIKTPLNEHAILFVAKDEAAPGYELPEVDAMVLAQDKGIPTINGYSGRFPPGNIHNPIERCISAQERLSSFAKFTGAESDSTIAPLMKKIITTPNISCGLIK
jgi:hypothetical protein